MIKVVNLIMKLDLQIGQLYISL